MSNTVLETDFVLGNYPHTAALLGGNLKSERVNFRFRDLGSTTGAFRRMVRHEEFGICEMAVVTHLQAWSCNGSFVLVPSGLFGRFPFNQILCRADRIDITPDRLKGLRIGVRSWTKTTGVWLRGMLGEEYGLDLNNVHWVSFEDGHVVNYREPVERAQPGQDIIALLLSGELDVVIGERLSDKRLRMLFADPEEAGRKWYAKHRTPPINHMVVIKRELARRAPWLRDEVYDLLQRSRDVAKLSAEQRELLPFGIDAVRRSLEKLIQYSLHQQVLSSRISVDELFDILD